MSFAEAVVATINRAPQYWRTANTTPSLQDLRGRIQLFRRFTGPDLYAYGINVTRWEDNPVEPFTIRTFRGVQLTIQDHYNPTSPVSLPSLITMKTDNVIALLDRASADQDATHWYINFTSVYEINYPYLVTPREAAIGGWFAFAWLPGINAKVYEYFKTHAEKKRYGIVVMDFPESPMPDLIAAVRFRV
ncbi:hypothetical protein LTR66_003886 [Elasticomyces elasticus]|nr:hypothetical protein LTR66_003886 [Elasticomyces elasticus]